MTSSVILLLFVLPCVLSQIVKNDVCKETPDNRRCRWLTVRWTYNSSSHECREYFGCDTVGNIYDSEESCYSKCQEKIITLHPPQNVTAAFTHSRVYLYWSPPINFILHEPELDNSTIINSTESTNTDQASENDQNTKTDTNAENDHDTKTDPNAANDQNTKTDSSAENNQTSKPDANTENDQNAAKVTTTPPSAGVLQKTNSTANNSDTVSSDKKVGANGTSLNLNNSTANVTEGGVDGTAAPETSTEEDSVLHIIAGTNLSLSDFYGKTRVPFHFAKLTHYDISVWIKDGDFVTNITVPGNTTEKQIPNLQPSIVYSITVSAVYLTNSAISAKPLIVTMRSDPSMAQNCFCDGFGSKNGHKACNLSLSQTPWCDCKHGYAGLFCEVCAHGYYRTALSLPCHQCPCSTTSSTGSCHFVEGYLHCTTCKQEYAGNLCHRCGNGYYRDHSVAPSRCIKCNKCHNIKPGPVCDQFTGKCLNCFYNTTGDYCEKCRDGFKGDPANDIPCTKIAEAGYHPPAAGVIAACVIATIVLVSGLVGFIIYKRMNNFPANRPFWTIEFKEDHDKVNFSAVPEDELERQHDDMAFYETQSKSKTKLPPYSQLREEM